MIFESEVLVYYQKCFGKAKVRWEFKLTCRPWGISSFSAMVPSQLLSVEWKEKSEDSEIPPQNLFIQNVVSDVSSNYISHLIPEQLIFWDNEWHLEFQLEFLD